MIAKCKWEIFFIQTDDNDDESHITPRQLLIDAYQMYNSSSDNYTNQQQLNEPMSLDLNASGGEAYNTTFSSLPTISTKDCDYLKLVMGFQRTLVIPDAFFVSDTPICYCRKCVTSESTSVLTGRPMKLFRIFTLHSFHCTFRLGSI